MTKRYVLEPASFASLAAGELKPHVAHQLFSAQLSEYSLRAAQVLSTVRNTGRVGAAVEVLSRSQERSAPVVAAMCHESWWGAWVARCEAGLRSVTGEIDLEAEVARIGAFAAVAAQRTGLDAETWTMVRDGRVTLPGLGSAMFSAPDRSWARIRVSGGTMAVDCEGRSVSMPAPAQTEGPNWLFVRRLRAEHGGRDLTLLFDDLDPYRDCYETRLADRVPVEQFARWRALFAQTWALLNRYASKRADELSMSLRVLVPLAEPAGLDEISVTTRDAFGALAMTAPTVPARFAVGLVHERSHSTLNGVLNQVSLYDPGDDRLYFAPWRPDPRPIGGLLHGAYAFLAVTDTWLALSRDPALRQTAEHEFAMHRARLDPVMDTLASANALTAAGRVFVAGMRGRCDALKAEAVTPVVAIRAQALLRAQHAAWRLRNRPAGRPSPHDRSATHRDGGRRCRLDDLEG